MVNQVKVVGILMIVHGCTVMLMGGLLAFLGSFMAFGMGAPPPPAAGGPPPGFQEALTAIYIVWGAVVIVIGLLNAIAGYRIMYFRGRVLALVALFSNIVVLLTCYCALTGIGIMVYGLIVLFNADVAAAFVAVSRGASPEEVISRYTPRYNDMRDDYDEDSRGHPYREDRRTQWDDEDDRRRDEDDRPRRDDDRD